MPDCLLAFQPFTVFFGQKIHPTVKVSEEVNRKSRARNTTI